MKVKALLILSFLTFSQQIFSQKNMVLGYIIKQNGDTTKGKVDDGFWSKNPTKINFSTNDTDIKTYDAVKELKGFGINEKSVYVRKKIAIDITPYENSSLLETSERIIVSDTTLMLRHLVKGKVNLYFLRDNKSKPHFFAEKITLPIAELVKHDYIKVVGSRKIIVKEKLYNNQLSELFKDNSIYENKVLNLEYTEPSLSAAVSDYNKNFGSVNNYEAPKSEKLSATVFLQIGVGQYGYNTKYSTPFSDYNFQKSSIFIPSLGLKGLFEIPSKRRKWSISTDVNFNTYSEGVQIFVNSTPQKDNAYLNFAIAPQYSFYKNKEKHRDFYALAGFTWEVPLNNNDESYNLRNRPRFGYKTGVGYRIQKFNLELTYFQNQANEGFLSVNSQLQRFMFTVGYAIF
jgi:hypothetical protein